MEITVILYSRVLPFYRNKYCKMNSKFILHLGFDDFSIKLRFRCLTIIVCGRAYRGLVFSFPVFYFQIDIGSLAVFNHSVFEYMCFTVMFHG